MKVLLPQECEVWYVLPFLRKQLATLLKNEFGHSQKSVAEILGVTEAAVSQYMHDKRGEEVVMPQDAQQLLRNAAQQLHDGVQFLRISQVLLKDPAIVAIKCSLHKRVDASVPEHCTICMQ